jgi:hypothetical protein
MKAPIPLGPRARALTAEGSRPRRLLLAFGIYVACTVVYFTCAPRHVLTEHTQYNHYALLADGWLHGRLDLGHAPPAYTQNNDFAQYKGKWFISFPPFPALLLLPWAKLAGEPENLRDGQVWLWVAGIGPAVLFLVLEKLRRMGASDRAELTNFALSTMFAFGTVYFFSAEQGTVWFSAHVVSAALAAFYVLASLDAEHPVLAGTMISLMFATRGPPISLAGVFFLFEAFRKSCPLLTQDFRDGGSGEKHTIGTLLKALDAKKFAKLVGLYALPIGALLGVLLWHNSARFGSVFEFGHNLLTVGWRARIDKWGLFSYHYLARNLGIVLSSLPYITKGPPHVQINSHGLALWVTTPIYLWLLWPKRKGWLWGSLLATVLPIALFDLLYQNSGWIQFGYRFSNDYALFLFAMLAVGGFRFGRLFWTAAAAGVAINTFGALTFQRSGLERFYFTDGSQQTIYQPD